MSERKVLNKYYPPDFDPSKIPRMRLAKNRQYTVRLMAPFNMRCKTCGEYIYRGKKFNARKEDVENDDYCGIRIYRFYIKCTRCLQEISFKTDPENTDYVIEAGATRNFMALKLAQEQEERDEEEQKEEEASNPMKLLENRTEQSKQELELLESLEELRELNRRHYNIDFDALLAKYDTAEVKEKLLQIQNEKDDKVIDSLLKKKIKLSVITEEISDSSSINDNRNDDRNNFLNDETTTNRKIPDRKLLDIVQKKIDEPSTSNSLASSTDRVAKKSAEPSKKNKLLSNLVQRKTKESLSTPSADPPPAVNILKTSKSEPPPKNALSLLGSYSDSE